MRARRLPIIASVAAALAFAGGGAWLLAAQSPAEVESCRIEVMYQGQKLVSYVTSDRPEPISACATEYHQYEAGVDVGGFQFAGQGE